MPPVVADLPVAVIPEVHLLLCVSFEMEPLCFSDGKIMPPARFERTTPGLGILCSIHLSYGGAKVFQIVSTPMPSFPYSKCPTSVQRQTLRIPTKRDVATGLNGHLNVTMDSRSPLLSAL
jgi:hypothetical protein